MEWVGVLWLRWTIFFKLGNNAYVQIDREKIEKRVVGQKG